MLYSLHIENIAVIRQADIDFRDGFTILSGQTGAGKSIILDAIGLILGDKADKELIRHGEIQASVEAVFGDLSAKTLALSVELGINIDEDGKLLISRMFSRDGKSQIKANGRSITLAVLRSIAPSLVSIHGQSDTNALVDSSVHISLVDTYAGVSETLDKYSQLYRQLEEVRGEIASIEARRLEGERLKEILEYQIKDIDQYKLHDGEEEELVDKKIKIRNSEKITKSAELVYKALKGSEKGSVSYLLDRSATALSQIAGVVPDFADYAERLRDMVYQVEDISEEVYAVLDDFDGDPTDTLNAIESRLDKISKLKRKYGLTIKDILEFRDRAAKELSEIVNSDDILLELAKKEASLYESTLVLANELHTARVDASRTLEVGVKETLEFLDMPKVVFFAKITEKRDGERMNLGPLGYDELEFYISANLGADALPMSKIASGGELARVMLALKGVISDKDGVSTVIFDEIDAGVSGKTARKIGVKMRELAVGAQIICVTHSAQIASLGDTHFLITKETIGDATETKVRELDFDGRVAELSRILGGISVTESQRRAALDMLNLKEQ